VIVLEGTMADLGPAPRPQRTIPQFAQNYVMLTLATLANAIDAADRKAGDPKDIAKRGRFNVVEARAWLRGDGWERLADISMFIDIPNECQYKAWLAEREVTWAAVDAKRTT